MAAYIKFKDITREREWHVGFPLPASIDMIANVESVQIDGHEAEIIYGFGMNLKGDRVHTLEGNEAKLYCLFVQTLYSK